MKQIRRKEFDSLRCGCAYGNQNYVANYYAGYGSSIGGGNIQCANWGDPYQNSHC